MLTRRYFQLPNKNCFMFGPQGAGKSTWIKKHLPNAYVINLLDEETYRNYSIDSERIKSVVAANQHKKQFVIDEVQKIPKILNSLRELIEAYPTHQFILISSNARNFRRETVNLLGVHTLFTNFHPFMATELGDNFDLDYSLNSGLIPLILAAREPQKKLSAYIDLYLKEEIKIEGIREIGTFSRFLEVISFFHGNVLNLDNIVKELQSSRKVVENYISILEDLFLGFKLPLFNKHAQSDYTVDPKFYWCDAGIYYHLRQKEPLVCTNELNRFALAGLVLQHLKAWSDYSKKPTQCYFWRTPDGAEVDFILYGEDQFYALEVKNSITVHPTDLRSLKTFCEDYPSTTPLLLFQGKEKLIIDNIPCWPIYDFLINLVPNHWPIKTFSLVC
jgi:uncharacterized protein